MNENLQKNLHLRIKRILERQGFTGLSGDCASKITLILRNSCSFLCNVVIVGFVRICNGMSLQVFTPE